MNAPHEGHFLVPAEAIDGNGHANNVEYVRWMQEIARSHSEACGGAGIAEGLGAAWVVRSHHIEYLKPLREGDSVAFGEHRFDVLHCPGHTPGHVVFVNHAARFALVGDVLFQGSVGRTDFPYGDHAALIRAITEKLLPLGDDFAFLCGHGPGSTIGAERQSNPFLR